MTSPLIELGTASEAHRECRLASEFRKKFSIPLVDGRAPGWEDNPTDETQVALVDFLQQFAAPGSDFAQSVAQEVYLEAERQEIIQGERALSRFVPEINRTKDGIRDWLWKQYGAVMPLDVVCIRRIGGFPVVFARTTGLDIEGLRSLRDVNLIIVVRRRCKTFQVEYFPEGIYLAVALAKATLLAQEG